MISRTPCINPSSASSNLNYSTQDAAADSLGKSGLRLDDRGSAGNHSPMASPGLCFTLRPRVPESVSSGERGPDRAGDLLGQDLRRRAKVTSRRPSDLELYPEEPTVGEQPSAAGLSVLGLAQRRERRPQLLEIDLGVQGEAGQV